MRSLPEMAGFDGLDKAELKRDTRHIYKSWLGIAPSSGDTEKEDGKASKQPNFKPECLPESTLTKRKARYQKWQADPSSIEKTLEASRGCLKQVRKEMNQVVQEEAKWYQSLELSRLELRSSTSASMRDNDILKAAISQFMLLSSQELGYLTRNKRKSTVSRDLAQEMVSFPLYYLCA
jgi:hypothetical protein